MSVKKVVVGMIAVGSLALGACGSADAGDAGTLKLADKDTADDFHPASGYGQAGISPIYDGLLRPDPASGPDRIPDLVPALAAEEPEPNADASEWTVKLRGGVTFHDGTAFDAADVKATYDAARDASTGSKVSMHYDLIDEVRVVDDSTVAFELAYPYGGFASRLTLPIAPSELVDEGTLGEKPVGTGPYEVTSEEGTTVYPCFDLLFWE